MAESFNMRRRWRVKEAARFIDVVSAVAFRLEVEEPSCSSMCEEIRSAKTTKTKQNLNSGLDRVIGTLEINILEIKTQRFKGGNQNAHIL